MVVPTLEQLQQAAKKAEAKIVQLEERARLADEELDKVKAEIKARGFASGKELQEALASKEKELTTETLALAELLKAFL